LAGLIIAAALFLTQRRTTAPVPDAAPTAPAARSDAPAGREFGIELPLHPPEVILVATSARKAAFLLQQLYRERPDAMGRGWFLLVADLSQTARVEQELRKAKGTRVRFVAIDGAVSNPGDPLVAPVLKTLTAGGVYTTCVEFVE